MLDRVSAFACESSTRETAGNLKNFSDTYGRVGTSVQFVAYTDEGCARWARSATSVRVARFPIRTAGLFVKYDFLVL